MPRNAPRRVHFCGTLENIDLAKRMVLDLLAQAPACQAAHGHVEAEEIDFPTEMLGVLFGKKGWRIEGMRRRSGAQIVLNRTTGRETTMSMVVITGTRESIDIAKLEIEEVLRGLRSLPKRPTSHLRDHMHPGELMF